MSQAAKKNQPAPYEVGYAKPPVSSRFRKGQSGNPSGRPRGKHPTERAKAMALDEAYRRVSVRDGDTVVRIPALQAVLRSQIALAAKGNGPAQRAVLRSVQAVEGEREANEVELLKAAIEYKAAAERHVERRRQLGITEVDPTMPHPDDVVIDMHTGQVWMAHQDWVGPQGPKIPKDE
jgi:hypothetical protein